MKKTLSLLFDKIHTIILLSCPKTILLVSVLAFCVGLIPSVVKAKLVACVGDSLTYGYGIPDRNYNSYPAQLARMLKVLDDQWETQNFGVSGATLLRNTNMPYVLQNAYNLALASEPDVVIIMLGSNDTARASISQIEQNFIPEYLALIDSFAELPSQPKIFVCYPLPIFGGNYGSDTTLTDVIIPRIRQLPTYRAVEVLDLHTPFENSGHLFPDYLHPNTEGAMMMAEIFAGAILGVRVAPDFDGDGTVGFGDFCKLAQFWLKDELSVDISPPPNGDSIVDYRDLVGFVQYWLKEFRLLAHWKLDESEGAIARDSAGDKDGALNGDPNWQPAAGKVGGALQLDGAGDYISTEFALNPVEGSFSVFAWVKGGGPGQVVVSQKDLKVGRTILVGSTWLGADTSEGKLITALMEYPHGPLESQVVITDGQWHHVGLVYDLDALCRRLYVDGVEVAGDTSPVGGAASGGSLYIGAGKNLDAGSFFCGLIDDVRIYNAALKPGEIEEMLR